MYAIVAGGGKVGANVARSLLRLGNEVTLIEQRRDRFERARGRVRAPGAARRRDRALRARARRDRAPARRRARAHRRRRGQHGHRPDRAREVRRAEGDRARQRPAQPGRTSTCSASRRPICATSSIMALVEHEVPEHDLIHLLELRGENLEIVEVQIDGDSPSAGKSVEALSLPEGSRLISVMRGRPGGDRRRLDGARGGRPGARDPRAGQGGRATSRPASSLALLARRRGVCSPPAVAAATRGVARCAARRSRLEQRLDALRLGRAPLERRPDIRDRDHRGERRLARAPAGAAPRHGRLVGDLPPRRAVGGATHDAFFVTTTYGITLAIDAASGTILWRWTPPSYAHLAGSAADHDRDAGRRPEPRVRSTRRRPTGGSRSSPSRTATSPGGARSRGCRRARRSRRSLNFAERPRDRDDRRLHRRRAAVPGPRRPHRRRERPAAARLELALLEPARLIAPADLRRERLGDLGTRRRRRRSRQRRPPRRHGQRAVERRHELGRRGARPLAERRSSSATTRRRTRRSSNDRDLDLGSTSPVFLTSTLIAQGGKDGKIRLLSLARIARHEAAQGARAADRLDAVAARTSSRRPRCGGRGKRIWLIAADGGAHAGVGAARRAAALGLAQRQRRHEPGDRGRPALRLRPERRPERLPARRAGSSSRRSSAGRGHWNSPIVDRRPRRAARGQRERPRHERRARHLAPPVAADRHRAEGRQATSRVPGTQTWPRGTTRLLRPLAGPPLSAEPDQMSRSPRDLAPGVQHVGVSAAGAAPYFLDDLDRSIWMRLFVSTVSRYRWRCLAVCLLSTHWHAIVETLG